MSLNAATPPSPTPSAAPNRLKAERIQFRLQNMGWNIAANRRQISRRFQFATQKEAMAFLNLAITVAEGAQTPACRCPAFFLRGAKVRMTISAQGAALAAVDLALARSVSLLG